jgi:hypothetical protein
MGVYMAVDLSAERNQPIPLPLNRDAAGIVEQGRDPAALKAGC